MSAFAPVALDAGSFPTLPEGWSGEGRDLARRLYLRPLAHPAGTAPHFFEALIRAPAATGPAPRLGFAADRGRLLAWAKGEGDAVQAHVSSLVDRLSAPPGAFAGIELGQPVLMGVVNTTPDSFSDGGEAFDPAAAIARGEALRDAGAAIIDVGGESTRPGSQAIDAAEETRRVGPVISGLKAGGAVISIDTRRAAVMEAALAAGAAVINDVTALTGDPRSLEVAAQAGVPVVLMHMRGEPGTMQSDPRYDDPLLDVYDYLAARIGACVAAGIPASRLAVDPGIGFGKTVDHNLEILRRISLYHGLGCPIVLGVSRKSFIGRLSKGEPPKARLPGSLAVALSAVAQGVQILRVHDVAETRQALALWMAVGP